MSQREPEWQPARLLNVHPHETTQVRAPAQVRLKHFFTLCGLAAMIIAVSSCSSATSSTQAASGGGVKKPAVVSATPAAAPASLAPLAIGHFPATPDGKLALGICRAWSGLRAEYASRIAADTPYQLNQWFSGPAWATVQSDGMKLGDDPAYSNIETEAGVAITGDVAGEANARLLDKACAKAD